MKTLVSKFRTLLRKTSEFRTVGDLLVFFGLCATFGGRPAASMTAFVSLLTLTVLLTLRILGAVDASMSIEPMPRTVIHLFSGVPAVISAAVCLLVITPYIGQYGVALAVLWSVFGSYLLLSGTSSLISFGKLKLGSRREARKAKLDALLADLRKTLTSGK